MKGASLQAEGSSARGRPGVPWAGRNELLRPSANGGDAAEEGAKNPVRGFKDYIRDEYLKIADLPEEEESAPTPRLPDDAPDTPDINASRARHFNFERDADA